MFRSIFIMLMAGLICACSNGAPEPTAIETASLNHQEQPQTEAVRLTTEERAKVPFGQTEYVETIDQLLYVLPVTRSDVIDELGIILEGQTGDMVDLQTIKTCLKDYADAQVEQPDSDIVFKTAKIRWIKAIDESGAETAAKMASSVFHGCITSETDQCYKSCEAYSAAASTIGVLDEINETMLGEN